MASVEDRWHVVRDGKQTRTERYGQGRRWRVRWREHGASRTRSFTYKGEADRFARNVESALDAGTTPEARAAEPVAVPTVTEYAERWLASQQYGPSAQVQRQVALRVHLLPALGDRPIDSITPADAREWTAAIRGANATQRHRFRIASQMFAAAEDDGLIDRNPFAVRSVRAPRAVKHSVVPWDVDQLRRVEDALPPTYRMLVPLGAGLGLRSGEIFGLSVEDVDLDRLVVTVRRQVRIDAARQVFALPKYERTREVPLPEYIAERVTEHLMLNPARAVTLPYASRESREDGKLRTLPLVITSREGKALNRNYISSRIWRPALDLAGVPVARENGMHVLRHTYASTMLHAGVSIRAVSEYLGHADPGFTLRTYAHMMPSAEADARNALDAAMRPVRISG